MGIVRGRGRLVTVGRGGGKLWSETLNGGVVLALWDCGSEWLGGGQSEGGLFIVDGVVGGISLAKSICL